METNNKTDKIEIITCVHKAVPFMLCPKCNGEGKMNVINYNTVNTNRYDKVTCNLCNGAMVIPMAVIPD
jgi:hypothetical protein